MQSSSRLVSIYVIDEKYCSGEDFSPYIFPLPDALRPTNTHTETHTDAQTFTVMTTVATVRPVLVKKITASRLQPLAIQSLKNFNINMMLRNSVNFSLLQISSQLRNFDFTETQEKESIPLKFLFAILKSFLCFCYIVHLTMSSFTIRTVSCGHQSLTVSNLREKQKFVMAAEYDLKCLAISKSLSCLFSCNALR